MAVSIHAPAWGATRNYAGKYERTGAVSIHAPAWGATYRVRAAEHRFECFNPRARVGRDTFATIAEQYSGVSIHAPAWGATQAFGNLLYYYYVSIHAPAWGAT